MTAEAMATVDENTATMMIRVYSSQFNYKYGSSIHVPYSIASLFSYISSFDHLNDKFDYQKSFIFRDKIDEYLDEIQNPDLLLCSCYVWNWEITNVLAKSVKTKFPDCKIIFGGPSVPLSYEGDFFEDHDYVDILVHQEGEKTIKEIFESYLIDRNLTDESLSLINGLQTKKIRTPPQSRINDLDSIPSPYLNNLIWDLVEDVKDVDYIVAWETNRGCPFECTFCDWGSATKTKVRKWDIEKLFQEIEWFADNEITYIDCCDANFGIFASRDLQLTTKLKEQKVEKGYPGRIRPAWAKVSSDRIIPIAKELIDADLLRAVTLAVQSLDFETLSSVKRKNIKFDKYENLVKQFRDHKIESYTEIIMGMPGETIDSYKNSLNQMMKLFPRPVVFIYNCGVFVNAPMNDPDYKKKHEIKTIRSPIYLWHSSVDSRGDIQEYEDIVISTSTCSTNDLKEMFLYGWAMQTFHSLGILEYISKFYYQSYQVEYIEFYEMFLDFCEHSQTLFNQEYLTVKKYIDIGYSGEGWDHYDKNLSNIFWPIEEATWLRCCMNSTILSSEIRKFLIALEYNKGLQTAYQMIYDLVDFQVFLLMTRDRPQSRKRHSSVYDWRSFLISDNDILRKDSSIYSYKNKIQVSELKNWCHQAVWIGRSQCNYKFHPEFLDVEYESKKVFPARSSRKFERVGR